MYDIYQTTFVEKCGFLTILVARESDRVFGQSNLVCFALDKIPNAIGFVNGDGSKSKVGITFFQ